MEGFKIVFIEIWNGLVARGHVVCLFLRCWHPSQFGQYWFQKIEASSRLSHYNFFEMCWHHSIAFEVCLRCQRHVGCKSMWLGSKQKTLVMISIMFSKFHKSSFFGSWSGGERYKKESIWNFKNKVKIVPKILLYDNSHISLHPTCLWHLRQLSKEIEWCQNTSQNL